MVVVDGSVLAAGILRLRRGLAADVQGRPRHPLRLPAGRSRRHRPLPGAAPGRADRFQEQHPDVPIWTAAIDEKLNEHGYIVPGLGDCGDRMFGTR